MRAHDVSKCKMFQDSLKPQYKRMSGGTTLLDYFWAFLIAREVGVAIRGLRKKLRSGQSSMLACLLESLDDC